MDYLRYQKIARDQIKKYGQVVTFHFPATDTEYNPITGENTGGADFDESVYAVLASPTERASKSLDIKIGDAVLLIDGGTLEHIPNETCSVTVAGEEWNIVNVSRVAPSTVVIIYKILIRKS